MLRLTKLEWLLFVLAAAAGTGLHFLYDLLPVVPISLIAPVNESLWEHVKLLYWPCLIAGFILHRRDPGKLGQRAFSLLVVVAGMLAIAYVYHIVLQQHALVFDIVLFLLMTALFFLLPHLLEGPIWQQLQRPLLLLAGVLGGAIILFTFFPPDCVLFQDFSVSNSTFTGTVLLCQNFYRKSGPISHLSH